MYLIFSVMKILFLTDNFPPESNAPATRTYEHCKEWLEKGAEITVITCFPNYPKGKLFPGYKNKLYQVEEIDGIRVIRVWTFITPNRGTVKRILDYLSYCFAAFIASWFVKTDLIIATSPQLFTALAGYMSSVVKRRPWIMEVRDLWPESIKAVGAIDQSTIIKLLDRLVDFLYNKASSIVVVTDSFKNRMVAHGVRPEKVHIIKNGVHMHKFIPREKEEGLLKEYGLEDKFVVTYIGTHGMAHKLDFILDCAAEVKDETIHFLFVGAGAMRARLIKQKEEMGLTNCTFIDAVPKAEVVRYISISDVALVNLRKQDTFTKVIPSKIFENASMLKPILLGVEGEAKAIVENYHAGIGYEPENKEDFLEKLQIIYADKEKFAQFKEGCRDLAKAFDRKILADRMFEEAIKSTAKVNEPVFLPEKR